MPYDRLLARVTVPAIPDFVPALRQFMMQAARVCVASPDELPPLGTLVEEVALHVIRTAFDPGEEGEYTAELVRRVGQIVFAIEDKGLPAAFDIAPLCGPDPHPPGLAAPGHATGQAPVPRPGIAPFLPAALAHAVSFRNLGRGGKRLEVARNLAIPPSADTTGRPGEEDGEPPRAVDEVVLRLLEPADAPALSRLMYRSYGYTYGSELVYYPERIVEMLERRRLVSLVAVNQPGEVVGHLAMLLHEPDSPTGETAMAAVDPRYRGGRLFERMKDGMRDLARERRIYGLYSEAVAVHTFTQKGNLALGGFETGFLLGFTPATQVFKKISDGQAADRRCAVLFYLRTNPEPERLLYAPDRHRDIMAAILERGGMSRRLQPAPAELSLRSLAGKATALDVSARPDVGRAFLTVRAYGGDVLKQVLDELRELCRRGYACIYLELPLSDPMTAVLCKGFESFGFFFAGLLFEVEGGDSLRLQYLNGVTLREDDIQVASDFGRSLLDYVLTAKEAVELARIERRKYFQVSGQAPGQTPGQNRGRRRADRHPAGGVTPEPTSDPAPAPAAEAVPA